MQQEGVQSSNWFSRNATDSEVAVGLLALRTFFLQNLKRGSLVVIDASDQVHEFGDGAGPQVTIRLRDRSLYWKLVVNPSFYLGESYMDGSLAIEEGGLDEFFDLVLGNLTEKDSPGSVWLRTLDSVGFLSRRLKQFNTLGRSRANVSHHYDLSSDFYELFLDPERQYSCAYFLSDSDSLEDAQKQKMRHLLSKLMVEPNHHVLDIGSGWGGLARFIARETGARVTGITLSTEQLEYAEKKTEEEGLSGQVRFKLCDYRKIKGTYDRVVSVGMFEHVGINHYSTFFQALRRLVGKQGVALLHSIGRSTGPAAMNPWIQKHIFPGAHIPSISEVVPSIEKSGLIMTDLEVLRLHYAKTLKIWKERFLASRDQAEAQYGEDFCRMWEFYLSSSEASFKYFGHVVFQMQLSESIETVPLTRDYLYDQG